MNGNKTLCSIKGCTYKGVIKTMSDGREIRLCPRHKHLATNPLRWEKV